MRRVSFHRLGLIGLVCAVMVAAACQPTPAPPTESVIAYGQTVEGQLNSGESHWLFGGKGGDTLSISFTSPGTPSFVALLDPGDVSIARVSMSTGRLDRFRLPADGQYTIVIGAGSGSYSLTLLSANTASAPTAPATQAGNSKNIAPGDSRLASLTATSAGDLWALQGQAGLVISIQMNAEAGGVDPALRLFGPDGALIASDDGRGRSALLTGVKLPASGLYLIQASGKGRAGDYLLVVQPGSLPTPTVAPTATIEPSPEINLTPTATLIPTADSGAQIRIGQTVEGLITNPQDMEHFAVFGPAGTVMTIGMFRAENSQLAPAFEVYGPDGSQVAAAASPDGAIVSGYTLPATGAYIIYTHADHSRSSGPYLLTIGDGLTLREIDQGDLTPNVAMTGHLARTGDRDVWSLELPANATFSVEVAPGQSGLDPEFDIIGPDGASLGKAQPDPRTHIAKLPSVLAQQQGRARIRVSGKGTGSYQITAQIVRVLPTATFDLALDQTITAEVHKDERYTYTFKAVPGMVIVVEAQAQAPDKFDPVIEFYGPTGRRLAIANDTSTDSDPPGAFLQTSLDDGFGAYTVQVHGYAMTPGTFTLHIRTE